MVNEEELKIQSNNRPEAVGLPESAMQDIEMQDHRFDCLQDLDAHPKFPLHCLRSHALTVYLYQLIHSQHLVADMVAGLSVDPIANQDGHVHDDDCY